MTKRKQRYPQPISDNVEYLDFDQDVYSIPKKRQKHSQIQNQPKKDSLYIKSKFSPKSLGQEFYLTMLNECTITFCIGPAGTGKTWIATRFALEKLLNKDVDRIVVTKPIIESGDEKLGALPGEVDDKVLPHFQSVLDCFEEHLGPTITKKLLDTKKIEFLPTAYARGRTMKHTYVIIDEAQNLTKKGLKLLLTRIGEGSLMSINGDTDQIDLPNESKSGLDWAVTSLKGKSSEIGIAEMTRSDNQRHPLIDTILCNLK